MAGTPASRGDAAPGVTDASGCAAAAPSVATRHGRRLGGSVDLTVVGPPAVAGRALRAAWAVLEDREARWSRFRDDSEVSALNAGAGRPVPVSDPTRRLLRQAIDAWRLTGGRVDALVLGDLLSLGYDQSHERLPRPTVAAPTGTAPTGTAPTGGDGAGGDVAAGPPMRTSARRPTVAAVVVDDEAGTATVPAGTGFDPGGVGKGRIADEVVAAALAAGADGACADLGGDVAVAGTPPTGDAWHVAIADPGHLRRTLATVALTTGAVATSSVTRRRWRHGTEDVHHLVDPATGRPSRTDVAAATVLAAEARTAEVLAKAVVLAGLVEGIGLLVDAGATGLVVADDGAVIPVVGFDDFAVGDVAPVATGPTDATRPGGR